MEKLLLILFATLLTNSFSQTNTSNNELNINSVKMLSGMEKQYEIPNFYPLAIGNKWIYDEYYFNNGDTSHSLSIMEVNGIYLKPNGELYYIWEVSRPGYPGANIFYERIDSSSAKIYKYDANLGLPNDEYMIDDLLAEPADTVLSYRFYPPGSSFTIVIKDTLFEKWGLIKTKRVFQEIGSGIPKPSYSLTQDIGLDSMFFVWDNYNYDTYVLKGCVLKGIVYGDTITVSVEDEERPIAGEFRLEQNYPNPFNPTTKIKFSLPSVIANEVKQSQLITLKVYDILGNEITTLVNEEKPAGEYEVEFDGTLLPSGIYFYKLQARDYNQTRKMILMK